jgi:acyl-CoA-binding protein
MYDNYENKVKEETLLQKSGKIFKQGIDLFRTGKTLYEIGKLGYNAYQYLRGENQNQNNNNYMDLNDGIE